jgi:Bacterial archaeo-eukaryotic release factor family 7
MNIPSKTDLRSLLEPQSGPCITIMLSTYRTGVEMLADQLKLRNAIRETWQRLHESGLRSTDDLLEPIRALLENETFWKRLGDGLVIFRAPGLFRTYRVPSHLKDLVVITDHFYLKPLLPLVADDGRFYVLALSQNDVRLLVGTRYSIQEMALPEAVPHSLAEALKYDDIEDNDVRHHSTSSGAIVGKGGRRAAVFHGQGVGIDDSKDQLLRYFQQINHGLHEMLRDATVPLVLAGVDYLMPIYREANTYPHLVDQEIAGNPDRLKAEALHELAWAIVEPLLLEQEREAVSRYQDLVGTWLASSSIEEVLPAAFYGRVESLFVALDQQQWGRFDLATNALALHTQAQADDVDLLDVAATQALLHGGKVYAVERTKVPGESLVAAVFRY